VPQTGFLGSNAPWPADATLLLEIAMGIGLLAGALFARRGRYRLHATCQSAIVVLNFVVILLAMLPAFHHQVLPKLPGRIGRSYYALATVHAAMGSAAEVAALYILLGAGTTLQPERLRLRRYKFWMRMVLFIWWIALLLGVATYVRWYVAR
jgi:uncharacterized membrane protein YozB (DUF420 family)